MDWKSPSDDYLGLGNGAFSIRPEFINAECPFGLFAPRRETVPNFSLSVLIW
jgi:hypothetical protein